MFLERDDIMPTTELSKFISGAISAREKLRTNGEIESDLTMQCDAYFRNEKEKKFSDTALKEIIASLTIDKKAKSLIKSSQVEYLFYHNIGRIKEKARLKVEEVLRVHMKNNRFDHIFMLVLARYAKSDLRYGYPIPMMTVGERAEMQQKKQQESKRKQLESIKQRHDERLADLQQREDEAQVPLQSRMLISKAIWHTAMAKILNKRSEGVTYESLTLEVELAAEEEYFHRRSLVEIGSAQDVLVREATQARINELRRPRV